MIRMTRKDAKVRGNARSRKLALDDRLRYKQLMSRLARLLLSSIVLAVLLASAACEDDPYDVDEDHGDRVSLAGTGGKGGSGGGGTGGSKAGSGGAGSGGAGSGGSTAGAGGAGSGGAGGTGGAAGAEDAGI